MDQHSQIVPAGREQRMLFLMITYNWYSDVFEGDE
jgi:hypothetical protein